MSAKTEKKAMFEKVRSNLDKKTILNTIVESKGNFFCKESDDTYYSFTPIQINEKEGVYGVLNVTQGIPTIGANVIVNFEIGKEKYFMLSVYKTDNGQDVVTIPESLYRLQRRSNMRADLDARKERRISIAIHNGGHVRIEAECVDLSVGGAKVIVPHSDVKLVLGDSLYANYRIYNRWNFEATALIKFCKEEGAGYLLGLEFINSNKALVSKLQMIIMEVRRAAALKHL